MKKLLYFIAAVAVCVAMIEVGERCASGSSQDTLSVRVDSVRDTITIVKHDTMPAPAGEQIVKYIPIPVPHYMTDTDTVVRYDTVRAAVVQRRYTDDSTYTAYVSGLLYDPWPRLDSIDVQQRVITNTITKTITLQQRKHWHLGIQAGYGFGIQSRRFEPYVGVGVGYEF